MGKCLILWEWRGRERAVMIFELRKHNMLEAIADSECILYRSASLTHACSFCTKIPVTNLLTLNCSSNWQGTAVSLRPLCMNVSLKIWMFGTWEVYMTVEDIDGSKLQGSKCENMLR